MLNEMFCKNQHFVVGWLIYILSREVAYTRWKIRDHLSLIKSFSPELFNVHNCVQMYRLVCTYNMLTNHSTL